MVPNEPTLVQGYTHHFQAFPPVLPKFLDSLLGTKPMENLTRPEDPKSDQRVVVPDCNNEQNILGAQNPWL
jgi:hypothetical protein